MNKNRFPFILALAACIILTLANGLHAKKTSYWDYFKDPSQLKTTRGYDIDLALHVLGPMNKEIGDHTPFGVGFLFGFHYQLNFFRLGFELGVSLFPGMGEEIGAERTRVTEFFISAPVYYDMGFDIKLHRIFSLVPFVSLGASIDVLRFVPGGISPLGSPGYEDRVAVHFACRAGLGFWFHINDYYSIQINAAYAPLMEFGDGVYVMNIVQLALGFVRRF